MPLFTAALFFPYNETRSFLDSFLGRKSILNRNDSGFGSLPSYAPLAAAYVPMQENASDSYEAAEALSRGTLFPGLDLPFMNIVNEKAPDTPMAELMAIDFVTDELELYLDTHADDTEAFTLYQSVLALREEARERYAARSGVITQCDQLGQESYTWLRDPWPWEFQNGRAR